MSDIKQEAMDLIKEIDKFMEKIEVNEGKEMITADKLVKAAEEEVEKMTLALGMQGYIHMDKPKAEYMIELVKNLGKELHLKNWELELCRKVKRKRTVKIERKKV